MHAARPDEGPAPPGVLARRRARRVVKQVVEHTAATHQHRCPVISELCRDLNVSERTLQYSFQEVLGLSPRTYLRYLRLNRVRDALRRPARADETVTRVAMQWHFLHLGRFSRDYQQAFHELPSTTLRRALGGIERVTEAG